MKLRYLLVLAAVAIAAAAPAAARAAGPLQTAVAEADEFRGTDAQANLALRRIRNAGATAFRVDLNWWEVVPEKRPATFNARDPEDPSYDWTSFDRKVRLLRANGLEPIAAVNHPPAWAQTDSSPADLDLFAQFTRAAAERYSGQVPGVPRVRYWQIWIEPNISKFFAPQFKGGELVAPALYRSLVNAASDSIHAVHRDNTVIAGGLSPFGVTYPNLRVIAPMRFMRALLCMSGGKNPKPTCSARVKLDIWAHHPYTSGGPTHHASGPDDVSLGDLPEMKRLLDAAVKAHHIVSTQRVRFWVTEFSWDTNPPDPKALPVLLQARWTSEALYRMWQVGISLVTWLELRDGPYPGNDVQSGLYYRGATLAADRAKPTLQAFRFPFVAYGVQGGVLVWGRTPTSKAATLVIERRTTGAWKRLGTLRANRYGIFTGRLASSVTATGYVRARLLGPASAANASRAFSLKAPPDRFVHPFG